MLNTSEPVSMPLLNAYLPSFFVLGIIKGKNVKLGKNM